MQYGFCYLNDYWFIIVKLLAIMGKLGIKKDIYFYYLFYIYSKWSVKCSVNFLEM